MARSQSQAADRLSLLARIVDLQSQLAEARTKHFEDCGKAKLSGYEEGKREARKKAFEDAILVAQGIEERYSKNHFPMHPADAAKAVAEALRRERDKP